MKSLLKWIAVIAMGLGVAGLALWGSLAIWFTEPVEHEGIRLGLVAGFAVLGIIGLVA